MPQIKSRQQCRHANKRIPSPPTMAPSASSGPEQVRRKIPFSPSSLDSEQVTRLSSSARTCSTNSSTPFTTALLVRAVQCFRRISSLFAAQYVYHDFDDNQRGVRDRLSCSFASIRRRPTLDGCPSPAHPLSLKEVLAVLFARIKR